MVVLPYRCHKSIKVLHSVTWCCVYDCRRCSTRLLLLTRYNLSVVLNGFGFGWYFCFFTNGNSISCLCFFVKSANFLKSSRLVQSWTVNPFLWIHWHWHWDYYTLVAMRQSNLLDNKLKMQNEESANTDQWWQ